MSENVGKPPEWPLWVKAALAYLRAGNWQQAAAEVRRRDRTLDRWRRDPRWPEAMAEAEAKWDGDTLAASKRTLLTAIEGGDAASARWYLERRDRAYAPPSQRVEHGGTVKHKVTIEIVDPKEPGAAA